ncbi:MAG: DNA-binding HGH1 [Lasallia pustulata]|uniref:DNA-binding HGH1 n=1 Tax=Lasallia pustulata TaxID=136370 RepID=A0A5M8PSH2_9LECA|nr:MAG: DNA-binding HGH1 [Lasallia pustulata]
MFKTGQLTPIRDLKLLVKDYEPIAKNALTILINISNDREVLENIAKDDAFLESLLLRITNPKEPNANELAMLLANMAKSDTITRLLTLTRPIPSPLTPSPLAIDQLLDCFVKGADNTYNPHANFDYLAYLFADLTKFPSAQTYFTTPAPPTPFSLSANSRPSRPTRRPSAAAASPPPSKTPPSTSPRTRSSSPPQPRSWFPSSRRSWARTLSPSRRQSSCRWSCSFSVRRRGGRRMWGF